ncbi:MAG: hypothetical protein QOF82_748 [Frankiales bacterium]|jgi:hypothetical protein|nr:hypothetical protein [Frankiales bacterium]MDX6211661.1 hypothetical protein [Frankiales bacterium]MDX6688458.1 hypothetical protein [Baekduia sp.]
MPGTKTGVGTHAWTSRTGGHLTRAETRSLLPRLAKVHAVNVVGRLAMLAHVNSGRRVLLTPAALTPPSSVLTRAAEEQAHQRLTPMLLGHSYRTYAFGMAIGTIEGVDVDTELLFAAAMLHDVGLTGQRQSSDFTLASARAARDLAENVGLSSTATEIMRTAITMHHSPGVTLADGAVAYLLSGGAGVDVAGLKSWQLPPDVLTTVVRDWPRLGFKRGFAELWRAEADAVPAGRARLLRRYGAFDLAVKLAPFGD